MESDEKNNGNNERIQSIFADNNPFSRNNDFSVSRSQNFTPLQQSQQRNDDIIMSINRNKKNDTILLSQQGNEDLSMQQQQATAGSSLPFATPVSKKRQSGEFYKNEYKTPLHKMTPIRPTPSRTQNEIRSHTAKTMKKIRKIYKRRDANEAKSMFKKK